MAARGERLQLKTRTDWDKWEKKVKDGQMAAQKRAYRALGLGRPNHRSAPPKRSRANGKGSRKPVARGAGNNHGFVCPVCFAQPETLRSDGVGIPRHLPAMEGTELYRDTQFCNGQGKVGLVVLDTGWAPGSKPKKTVTAREFLSGKVVV